MTFWTLMIYLLVFGTLGLGVTCALQWLSCKQRVARINLCLFHLETARDLAHRGNPAYADEVRRHLNRFRSYCLEYNFESTELGTDADEVAELLNRVMRSSAPPRPIGPIDIGAEDDTYTGLPDPKVVQPTATPPVPSDNPQIGSTPPPVPREAYELQLTGLHDLDFDEDK